MLRVLQASYQLRPRAARVRQVPLQRVGMQRSRCAVTESPLLVEEDEALKEAESGSPHEHDTADDFPGDGVLLQTEHPGPSAYPSTLISPKAVSLLLHCKYSLRTEGMRVYAAALRNEKACIATISSPEQVARSLDCLRHCLQQRPGYYELASVIESLGHQSRDIYLQQAMRKSCHLSPALLYWLEAESVSRIQRFKETLAEFPSGAQVLIWATFIAAPDCVLLEHQAFFTKVLRQYYRRSGFENVLRGLEYLEGI